MKNKSAIKLAAVVVLTVLVGLLAVNGLTMGNVSIMSVTDSISLGLDLRGGIYAVYVAEDNGQGDFDEKLGNTVEVLRRRLSGQGFNEAVVTRQGTNRIRVEIPDVDDPGRIIEIIGTPAHLEFVDPDGNVILEGKDIKNATAIRTGDTGELAVQFEMTSEGAQIFAKETGDHLNEIIAITLDNEILTAPTVNSRITDGIAIITGMSSVQEAQDLASLIMSGALPLDIEQDESSAVSATLGSSALENCLKAGLIGVILVFLFMLAVYRLPGLMADLALCIYILIVLYALALVPGVQLTLPGIAGILLGIGMAVDANVIIFERFREELAKGAELPYAVSRGFKSALSAVIDSNVTTIIVSVVLMFFGTGPIRGFAITLCIGVVASMITSVFVTRFLLINVVNLSNGKNLALYSRPLKEKARSGKSFYTAHTRVFALISVLVIVAAVGMSVAGVGLNFGIDFTGGSMLRYDMGQEFETADIAAALEEMGESNYQVAKTGEGDVQTTLEIRLVLGNDDVNAKTTALEAKLKEKYADMTFVDTSFIGANSGRDLITNAITSMLIAFGCVLLYIIIRFDFFLGLSAIIALAHDVLIMIAFMVFFRGQYMVNSSFVAALLTIVGYSINNTIVIFDRIRELGRNANYVNMSKLELVDHAVGSTITRTLNTTITTLLTLVSVFLLAGEIREFTFPLVVGMLAGTYSSVLLSGQVWARITTWNQNRKAKK